MGTAQFAKIMMESGQTLFDYTKATDSCDHTVFTVAGKTIWSDKAGYEAIIRPDGVVSGSNMLSPHATNDTVTIAGFTCYLAGVLTTIGATTDTITRPATAVSKINSIVVTSAGVIDVIAGDDGTTTAFSETRDAAGGPPLIPVGAIEIGQIRVTSNTAAPITADEIFQAVGTHCERFDYPVWSVNQIGDGDSATVAAKKNAHIEFASAIGDPIHTGLTYKSVYVRGYTPILSEISNSVDFKPAETSHSVSSTQVYNGTIGSQSSSLGQAGFTAMMTDGITDSLKQNKNQKLIFKFYPNRHKVPYSLTQGTLGIASTFPANNQIQASCTISAEKETADFAS